MNKRFSCLKNTFPFIALICGLLLIFFSFPNICIELFLIIDYVLAISIFVLQFTAGKTSANFYSCILINFYCFFTCGIAIATTRTFLSLSDFEQQLEIIKIIGFWICRENSLSGFFYTLMMSVVLIFFCKRYISRYTEISARYCLDSMNSELFDIDQKLIRKEITEDEAKNQKQQVSTKINYYSALDSSAQVLEKTITAFILLFIVFTVGGVSIGIVEFHQPWREAMNQYIVLSSGYLVVFLIPLFIVCLSLRIKK